ncbi:MAG: FHA domain-containing protein, partial [Acidobacteria bacterium]|nr:FHA domain-containing protein [Acidobacteriota bacterium]
MSNAILRWTEKPDRPTEYTLTGDESLIGRSPDADIVLAHNGVSRNHAKIVCNPKGYILVDLNSTNGTYVNESQVKEHLLRDGDRIRLGEEGIELLFQTHSTGEAPARSGAIEDGDDEELVTRTVDIWGGENAQRTMRNLASILPAEETSPSELEKLCHILDFHCYFEKTFSSEKTFRQILNSALQS